MASVNGYKKMSTELFYVDGIGIRPESLDAIAWRADPGQVGGYIYSVMLLFKSGKEMTLPDSSDARRLFKAVTGHDFDVDKMAITGNVQ